jgi:hypothetical protein
MTVHCKKNKHWLVYLLSIAKNRMSLTHLQRILEFLLFLFSSSALGNFFASNAADAILL